MKPATWGAMLTVDIVAGLDFEQAFWAMQNLAQNLGCQVKADLNDIIVSTYPRQPLAEFLETYQQARSRK